MTGVRRSQGRCLVVDVDTTGDLPHGHVEVTVTHVLVDEADRRAPEIDRWIGAGAVGTVTAVGGDVDPALAGVDVLVTGPAPCGRCATCRRGQPHLCLEPTRDGPATRGVGGARHRMVVAADRVTAVPTGMSMQAAAVLSGPGLTGAAAVRGAARLVPGERIAVVGDVAATIGAAIAVAAGARTVVACPNTAGDEALLRDWRATAVGGTGSLVDLARAETEGVGVDSCVVFGGPAEVLRDAVEATRPGGTVVVVDVDVERTLTAPLRDGRTLVDAPHGGGEPARDLPWLVRLLIERGIDLSAVCVTGAPGLDAVAAAAEGRGGDTRSVHGLG